MSSPVNALSVKHAQSTSNEQNNQSDGCAFYSFMLPILNKRQDVSRAGTIHHF